ncbi:MAG: hypothetical protein AAF502_13655 [Bacteroidota bacterium]
MKDILIILGIIGLFVLSVSGTKEKPLPQFADSNLGVIVANIEFGACFSEAGLNGTEWIVYNQEAYESLALLFTGQENCNSTTLPAIDFDQYTLLGVMTNTTCNSIYRRDIVELPEVKQVIYTVDVMWAGTCDGLVTNNNWVLIPKIDGDYTVQFFTNTPSEVRP